MESLSSFWQLITGADANSVKHLAGDHIGVALLVCFFSGILTSLTPCVYPMIPITINIFGRAAQQDSTSRFNKRTFFLAILYVAGMCLTYSILGVLAGLSGSLFGRVLQSPYLVLGIAVLFLVLALGQWGWFKMALPASLQTTLSTIGTSENRMGIFMMGAVSGLIVSPCVGPVIAGILAFVFDSSNAYLGFLYFLSFSLGLGVLFLLIGGFSGVLGKLPRSGKWMIGVNRLLALLMLFASLYYFSIFAKQVGFKIPSSSSHPTSGISWLTDESEALRRAREEQKPIIVDFAAEWCAVCHEMDALLFHNPKVMEQLEKFIPLRLDVTQDNALNTEKLKKYGVLGLPAVLFVTPSGQILEKPRVNGLETLDSFLKILNSVEKSTQ